MKKTPPSLAPMAPRPPPQAPQAPAGRAGDAAAPPHGVALSRQLQHVAAALQGIRQGRSGTAVLDAVPTALRPGVQALLFQVLRHLGQADALRHQLAARTPPPGVDALLCTALALVVRCRAAAVRALHAGEPGGRGGQARQHGARPSAVRQRLPAPLPARARCPAAGHAARPAGAVEPPALVDRNACRKTTRSTGSRSCGPTTARPPWCSGLTSKKPP